MERVYEIGRIFRNEGMDATHNPEFTSIEVYQAYADFHDIMDLTEGIIQHVAKAVKGDGPVIYQGTEIKINEPFKRVHMVDAIKEITGVDFWKDMTFEEAKAIAAEKKVPVEKHYTEVGHIINAFFEEFVEETLIQPTFVYGHPVAVSPLAKKNPEDERFTDRFESGPCPHSGRPSGLSRLSSSGNLHTAACSRQEEKRSPGLAKHLSSAMSALIGTSSP